VHNSDDDKIWNRFKSAVPHQKINLRIEGNSQVLSSGEGKTMLDETMDTQNPSSLNNSNSTNNSFQSPTQNMFVIKTTSGTRRKVTRFNKIKAINPIPMIDTLTPREEKPINRTFSAKVISATSRLNNLTPLCDVSMSDKNQTQLLSSEKKILNLKTSPSESSFIIHTRVASAQEKIPKTTIKLDKTTTPREKISMQNITTPAQSERIGTINKIYDQIEPRTKHIYSCPKPVSGTLHFDFLNPDKPARNKTVLNLDTTNNVPSLDLRSLISPQYRPQVLVPFQEGPVNPLKSPTVCNINLSETCGTMPVRKITTKFKNQEMIVNKIFNSNNHKKNL